MLSNLKIHKIFGSFQNNYDVSITKLNEKKDLLDNYQTMIEESQTAYSKLMDNTNKLIATLDIESQGIKNRFSNNKGNLGAY